MSKGERGSGRGGGSILQIATLRPPFSACKVVKCNLKAGSLRPPSSVKNNISHETQPNKKVLPTMKFSLPAVDVDSDQKKKLHTCHKKGLIKLFLSSSFNSELLVITLTVYGLNSNYFVYGLNSNHFYQRPKI